MRATSPTRALPEAEQRYWRASWLSLVGYVATIGALVILFFVVGHFEDRLGWARFLVVPAAVAIIFTLVRETISKLIVRWLRMTIRADALLMPLAPHLEQVLRRIVREAGADWFLLRGARTTRSLLRTLPPEQQSRVVVGETRDPVARGRRMVIKEKEGDAFTLTVDGFQQMVWQASDEVRLPASHPEASSLLRSALERARV